MDYQRYLLIGAVAVLSYMLLIEWGQYSNGAAANADSYQQQANLAPAAESLPNANTDLPSVVAEKEQVTELSAPVSEQLISVYTDSLEVKINPRGGDIEYAALPRHFAAIDTPDKAFVLLENNANRTYISQSGLIGKNGTDTSTGRPLYTARASEYRLQEGQDSLTVDLLFTDAQGVGITKRFTFKRGDYLIGVSYLIDNQSQQAWSAALFGQIKRDGTADPSAGNNGMGLAPYLGAATTLGEEEKFKKIAFDDMADQPFKVTREGGWIAILQHYFVSAWIPMADIQHNYSTLVTRDNNYIIRFTSPSVSVAAGEKGEITAHFYAGPKDQYRLEEISPGLELSVDYGWLWWVAQPLFWLLTKIHSLTGNWGYAIIGITVLVKAVFFQLNAKAYTSMANMRKVQPKLLELRERYADDRQKQSQEMMKLYQKEKINPLGGCLPILVQMPVFLALYWVLMESVELRHAPFILWINDLSTMDPYFILPLLMGASMFIQQKLNPPPPDPMQAKIMQWMPVLFTFFFLFFPAGLVLYWVVNNVLSIAQQYVITKRIENA
jgi:YidC/Oxa1 family membrane protein insertase